MADRFQFYPLYLTRFVASLGYITLLTLLGTYIQELGATGVVAGLFVTALGVGRTVAILPLGWAADRYDKRAILLFSLLLSGVSYALFTLVDSSLGFIVARTLQGLGMVGTGMVSLALVGGYLMDSAGMNWVFVLAGVTALTGVATFVGVVSKRYGPRELARW